jgi:hypothetical protein
VYDGGVRPAYLALVVAAACSAGGAPRPTGGDSGRRSAPPAADALDPRCEKVRPRVEALYRRAGTPAADKKQDADLAADLLAADVAMVMNDCRADPDRVAPCAERAADAAELERACLIPLDDEGAVDGDPLLKGT